MIIDDYTDIELLNSGRSTGCIERDYDRTPVQTFGALPKDIPLIPRSEWDARIQEQEERQDSLEHLYLRAGWENLDQNGLNYCWGYSTAHAMMLRREADHDPYVRLNPAASCAIIQRGANEGAWCGLSAQLAIENGYATEADWPGHSLDLRNDTPALREAMKRNRVGEAFIDLQLPAYDRNQTMDQIASCLLQNIPVALDFSWWGHSVCGVRLIKSNDGYGWRILNSWKNWGRRGLGDIYGRRVQTMGAVGISSVN